MMVHVLVGRCYCMYIWVRVQLYVDVRVHVHVGTCICWYLYVDTCKEAGGHV